MKRRERGKYMQEAANIGKRKSLLAVRTLRRKKGPGYFFSRYAIVHSSDIYSPPPWGGKGPASQKAIRDDFSQLEFLPRSLSPFRLIPHVSHTFCNRPRRQSTLLTWQAIVLCSKKKLRGEVIWTTSPPLNFSSQASPYTLSPLEYKGWCSIQFYFAFTVVLIFSGLHTHANAHKTAHVLSIFTPLSY